MVLSHAYDVQPPEADAVALLQRALDLGYDHFDSAALYGAGANERLLARALGARRDEVLVATKGVLDEVDGKRVLDGRPKTLRGSIDRSLARLGVERIALYYLHRLDPAVPIEESVGALSEAVAEGKIDAIGLSEMSSATIRRAHAVHPVAAVQSEYSPWTRNPELGVLETCRDLDIAFVAFSPMARGLLGGSVTSATFAPGDLRATMPRFQGDNLAHNLETAAAFRALAAEQGITSAQLALAWVLRDPIVVAIPGTRSPPHLAENFAAGAITLDADTLARIDAIFVSGAIRGTRYPAAAQKQIDTEHTPDERALMGSA